MPESAPLLPTEVHLIWLKGQFQRWIRFGRIADERLSA